MISIGLCCYNSEKYLRYAIQSIINQSYEDWELVFIDDGSKDNSMDIAISFNDSRIKIYRDGKNLGLAKRLNQTIQYSSGLYYARMDSDDIMHPDRLKKQLKYLEEHKNIDLIGSSAYIIDQSNKITGTRNGALEFSVLSAIRSSLFIHPSCFGRISWFRENPYDEYRRRSEDYELWLRTADTSHFANLPLPLIYYREIGLNHQAKYINTGNEIVQILKYSKLREERKYSRVLMKKIIEMKFKNLIYKYAGLLGAERILLISRSKVLSNSEMEEAIEGLNRAISSIREYGDL